MSDLSESDLVAVLQKAFLNSKHRVEYDDGSGIPYEAALPGICRNIVFAASGDEAIIDLSLARDISNFKIAAMRLKINPKSRNALPHNVNALIEKVSNLEARSLATVKKKGRPAKQIAERVSRAVLQEYVRLYNTQPSHYEDGDFVSLLSSIFEALSIKAKPAGWARKVLGSLEKNSSNLANLRLAFEPWFRPLIRPQQHGRSAMHASPLNSAPTPRYAPIPVAVGILGIGRSTIYKLAATGTLRLIKAGARTLVDMDHALAWMATLPRAEIALPYRPRP
jgi:hypothetical protein